MAFVIKIVRRADGEHGPGDGQYLVSFDHNANLGRGELTTQADVTYAMRFPGKEGAIEFYQRQSRWRPVRSDGEPNRPLTAYTVEIEDVP